MPQSSARRMAACSLLLLLASACNQGAAVPAAGTAAVVAANREGNAEAAPASGEKLPRFRDVQFYTTSQPAQGDPHVIQITTAMHNRGKVPLDVAAVLQAVAQAGFEGSRCSATIPAGGVFEWKYQARLPENFQRAVLTGEVTLQGVKDRDLFVALQGADPAGFDDRRVEKITARGAVVGTHAPRKFARVLASRQAQSKPAPVLELAARGSSQYRIVLEAHLAVPRKEGQTLDQWLAVPGLPPEQVDLLRAISDLVRCVRLQSGAELPVVLASAGGKGPAIRLQHDASRKIRATWAHPDAFQLRTAGGDVVIAAAEVDGLRHGIYTLLSDVLDCHWFQPGKIGEEFLIPADQTVHIPQLALDAAPSFYSASGMSWSYAPHWDRWNRTYINRGRMTFGHSWVSYVAPGEFPFEKFPDMYARDKAGQIRKFDNGWSSTNFCPTSPAVISVVAKKINAHFKANPAAIVASLDPNDYSPMCQCPRCLALDRKFGQDSEQAEEVADRLLWFSNEIYNRLEPQFRDKFLGILIYGYQMELPHTVQPHAHHAAMICNFPPRYDHTRPMNDPTSAKNRDFYRLVKGWGSRLKQFGFYDYYGHYYFFGPWGVIHKIREDMPEFRDIGGTFIMMEAEPCFASQGVNHYVASRLTWDVDADVDLLLAEFYEKYYGPAAEPMRLLWEMAERRYALTRPGTHAERAADDPEFWPEVEKFLQQAEQAVAGAGVPQRYKDRVQCHRDGLTYGKIMHRLLQISPHSSKRPPLDEKQKQEVLDILGRHRDQIAALKKKYTTGDYWPPFVPTYVWLDIDAKINELKKTGKFFLFEE